MSGAVATCVLLGRLPSKKKERLLTLLILSYSRFLFLSFSLSFSLIAIFLICYFRYIMALFVLAD